jgi:hypothetical protein
VETVAPDWPSSAVREEEFAGVVELVEYDLGDVDRAVRALSLWRADLVADAAIVGALPRLGDPDGALVPIYVGWM